LATVLAICVCAAGHAGAAEPVAIVEEASDGSGLSEMEYLERGRVIELRADDTAVIGYFTSCLRESIVGGTIVIGEAESSVSGGHVSREPLDCARSSVDVQPAAAESGVIVFRKPLNSATDRPHFIVNGRQPIFLLPGPGKLTLQRLDLPEPPIELFAHGHHLDLVGEGVVLASNATYRAQSNGRTVVFVIVPGGEFGSLPLLLRVVRF
jgi:hypothetical protein